MADYQDAKGKMRPLDAKGWPKGTENWSDGSGKTSKSIPMGNMRDLDRFMTGQHSDMQHPTQHNLSPVEGDHQAHRNYSADKSAKADWHYERWGNPKQPQATLARAGVNDFKSRVAANWPGDK